MNGIVGGKLVQHDISYTSLFSARDWERFLTPALNPPPEDNEN